jgi:hypothetical protein
VSKTGKYVPRVIIDNTVAMYKKFLSIRYDVFSITHHFAANSKSVAEYLCNLCLALMNMKCAKGETPLHYALTTREYKYLLREDICNIDEIIIRDDCTPSNIASSHSQQLPLHFLIDYNPPRSEVSDAGDFVSFCSFILPQLVSRISIC